MSRSREQRPEHVGFWEAVERVVREVVDERSGSLGTVVGFDGGKPVVHVDDEREPRSVGFPRKAGQRYAVGDRVKLSRGRAGEYVVDGSLRWDEGEGDRVVGGEDVRRRAVRREHIERGAVGDEEVQERSLRGNRLVEKAIGPDEVDDGAIETSHVAPGLDGARLGEGTTGKSKLTTAFQDEIDAKVTLPQVTTVLTNNGNADSDDAYWKGRTVKGYAAPANHGHDDINIRTTMAGQNAKLNDTLNALYVFLNFLCNGMAEPRRTECRCRRDAIATGQPGRNC